MSLGQTHALWDEEGDEGVEKHGKQAVAEQATAVIGARRAPLVAAHVSTPGACQVAHHKPHRCTAHHRPSKYHPKV